MNRSMILGIVGLILTLPLAAQNDTLYLDKTTGNYVMKYLAHLRIVTGPNGSKPYDGETPLAEGEVLTRRDTLVVVVIEPATRIDPAVFCSTHKENQAKMLFYSYTIFNGVSSVQRLNEFSVDFGRSIEVEDATPRDGWHSLRVNEREGDELMPGYRWLWWGDIGLAQGKGWTVGILKAGGLPAIQNSYLAGKTETPVYPGEGASPDVEERLMNLFEFPANRVVVRTIGPTSIPSTCSCRDFIDTLLSYTRQSAEFGWLAPLHPNRKIDWDDDCDNDEHPQDGIASNFDRRLRMAKRELEKGDSVQARKSLETLLQKVERVWKRSQDEDKKNDRRRDEKLRDKNERIIMTSEAYALLKYNLEYLIDRLPEKAKRDKGFRGEERK